jgi:hypothetical protein
MILVNSRIYHIRSGKNVGKWGACLLLLVFVNVWRQYIIWNELRIDCKIICNHPLRKVGRRYADILAPSSTVQQNLRQLRSWLPNQTEIENERTWRRTSRTEEEELKKLLVFRFPNDWCLFNCLVCGLFFYKLLALLTTHSVSQSWMLVLLLLLLWTLTLSLFIVHLL